MEITRATEKNSLDETRETLMMFGGVALVMLGAGMILTSPAVRKMMGGFNVAGLLTDAMPDFEKYMKMKAM